MGRRYQLGLGKLTDSLAACSMLPGIDLRSLYYCCYPAFAMAAFVAGVLVKVPVLRHMTRISWLKSAVAALAASAAWWALDVVVIGCAATACLLVWKVMLGASANGAVWVSIFLIAPMTRAGLETWLVRLAYSRRIGRKGYWLLCVANEVCIGVAAYALILYDRAHPPQA